MMDWYQRFARAHRDGGFTLDDKWVAEDWGSCAISDRDEFQRDLETPMAIKLQTINREATLMGYEFTACVKQDLVNEAEIIYRYIQSMVSVTK